MEALVRTIVNEVINPLIYLFFAIAALVFVWGVISYIANADDETKRREGRTHIVWGIIGLVIMSGAWGILEFIDGTYKEVAPDQSTTLDEFRVNLTAPEEAPTETP